MNCSPHCLAAACNVFEDKYAAAQCPGLYFILVGEYKALLACAQVTVYILGLLCWFFWVLQRVQKLQMPCRLLSLFGGTASRPLLFAACIHPTLLFQAWRVTVKPLQHLLSVKHCTKIISSVLPEIADVLNVAWKRIAWSYRELLRLMINAAAILNN